MADAFRGLTIKIGADDRKLQSALSSISRSASAAQKQLSMMQKGLRADSTNANMLAGAFELARDKAMLTARAARTVQIAIEQSSGKMVEFSAASGLGKKSIEQIATSTRDVYATTQKLTAQRTKTNAELQQIWDKVAKIYADENNISVKSEEVAKHMRTLKSNISGVGDAAKKARAEVKSLVFKAAAKTDIGDVFGLTNKNTFAKGNELWSVFTRLRKESKALQQDLEALEAAEGFRAMQYKFAAVQAELREAAAQAVRFRTELQKTGYGAFSETINQAKKLDSVIEASTSDARAMREVLSVMPRNIEAIKASWRTAKAEEDSLNQKLARMKSLVSQIAKSEGFDKTALNVKNVYAETVKATSAMEKLEVAEKNAQARLENWEQTLKDMQKNPYKKWEYSLEQVENEIKKTKNEMSQLKAKMLEADAALEKANLAEEFVKAKNEVLRLESALVKLKERASIITALGNFGRQIRSAGYGLYSTITPAITIMGRYAIQAANDIDASYRNMRKTVNGTEEEFEHLRDAALKFSQTHVTTADTILEIEALGGQLGIQASNLEAFAEVVSNLDIATDIDSESLATYIGQLSNIMNDMKIHKNDPEEYRKAITSFSDALVRLGNNSAAQESNIMKVMMRIASMGTISGFTTPELLAIADAVAATGQGAEAAGTAISKTFSNIEAAVGAGGKSLQGFADVAGMSAEEFAESWSTSPIEAFTAFIGGLKRIDEEGGSVDQTLAQLKISSVRQKQALLGLTQTYDVLTGSLQMANDAWDGLSTTMADGSIEKAGDAAREAQRKSEGFSGELQMMKNNAVLLAQELADGALPFIKLLGENFKNLASAFSALPEGTKTFTVGLLGIAATIGPVFVGLGAVLSSLIPIKSALMVVPNLFLKAAAALNAMNVSTAFGIKANLGFQKVLTALSHPGVLIGIAAIGTAFALIADEVKKAMERQENYRKSTDKLKDAVTRTIPVYGKLRSEIGSLGVKVASVKKSNDELFESIAKTADKIEERNKGAQSEIDILQQAENAIKDYMNQTGLSAQQQGELRAAVDIVNEKLGTEYKVVDGLNGKIADGNGVMLETADVIAQYIEARQKQVKMDALAADAEDLLEAKSEAYATYVSKLNEATEAEKHRYEGADAAEKAAFQDAANNAQKSADEAKAAYDAIDTELNSVYSAMGDAANATKEANQTIGQMANYSTEFRTAFESTFGESDRPWTEYFDSFRDSLNAANLDTKTFNSLTAEQIAQMAVTWKESGGDISATLASVGLEVRTLSNAFTTEFQNAGMSFKTLAEGLGVSVDELASSLSGAGISAQNMATVSETSLNEMVAAADGDINKFIELLLQADGIQVTSTVEANTEPAQEEIAATAQMAEQYGDSEESTTLDADNTDAMESFDETESEADSWDGSTYTATADLDTSPAWNKLGSLRSSLEDYANSTYSATVTSSENAMGGIFRAGIIPAHAAGGINGIVTRPTLTNVGLTGEAGDEAILHMRHAGGAIIPLSNRQHVRPFARAVASEMGYGGGSTTVYNINLSDFAINDDAEIRSATRDYLGVLLRKGAMNVG